MRWPSPSGITMSTRPVGRLYSRGCGRAPRSLAHSISTCGASGAMGRRVMSMAFRWLRLLAAAARRPHDRHAAIAFCRDLRRHAAQVAPQGAAAARPHHDVVDLVLARVVDDGGGGV